LVTGRDTAHFPARNVNGIEWTRVDQASPPVLESLDPAWRDIAITFARCSPRRALSFATWLEGQFGLPWEAGLRADAAKLAAWVRSTVKE
jgi:hypothetical protein